VRFGLGHGKRLFAVAEIDLAVLVQCDLGHDDRFLRGPGFEKLAGELLVFSLETAPTAGTDVTGCLLRGRPSIFEPLHVHEHGRFPLDRCNGGRLKRHRQRLLNRSFLRGCIGRGRDWLAKS